ncbi:transporter substrate-binding domain-containing protein [Noviherbaspirillum sp. Root189]|uniref:transporter substrate-binding domain-containing protein n=1 Tax=Noviherbaspirillum sp. Root189 TaxID=1736487 RepID=UPI00070E877A|nr:transporter substrate-binding domain-containing protein [Noviherbaspirillum sp. Root189]KRB70678.1 ABC transporter substrate-binding protein [Noviherbaspirillum sp. Root189]
MKIAFKHSVSMAALLGGSLGFLAAFPVTSSAADLLTTVKQKKEMSIGTEAQFTPFEFIKDGKIVGYSTDLLELIMVDLPGVRANRQDVPFQAILPGLAAKKFDFVVTSVTVTKERDAKFAFTLPIAEATVALLRRAQDGSFTSPEQLSGKVVGSQAGSAQLKVAREYDAKLRAAGKPGLKEIREYVAFDEAYADLAAGRLDAVAQSLSNLGPLVKGRPDTFAVVQPSIGPKTYYAWVGRKDKDSAPLVKFFSDGIARANTSGKMAELQQKWFGFTTPLPVDRLPAPEM